MRYTRPAAVVVVALIAFAAVLLNGPTRPGPHSVSRAPKLSALTTTPAALDEIIVRGRARVEADPSDGEAAVLLADALMRAARVRGDAALPLEGERALRRTLAHKPSDYPARRMLGVVLLSQHRFAEALEMARAAIAVRPSDAWNYAVAGDALLELGRYDEAFDAFDQVMKRRPDAAAYARVAYARELQGDLAGAERLMRMAAEGTGSHDPEAQAWTYAQLGNIYLHQEKLDAAAREFDRAEFTFPSHPYVRAGRVRLLIAQRRFPEALALVEGGHKTPEALAMGGDLLAAMGRRTEAEAAYVEAERAERDGWRQEQPQPGALARFLAERNRRIPEAVTLAERAAAERQDVNTLDALAWSYYRSGRIADASAAIQKAMRTGTADPRITCHAGAIAAASSRSSVPSPSACNPLAVMARSRG